MLLAALFPREESEKKNMLFLLSLGLALQPLLLIQANRQSPLLLHREGVSENKDSVREKEVAIIVV